MSKKATKAVRFSKEDEKLIQEFLKRNPMFDFSTMARVAIISFIKKPKIKLAGVSDRKAKRLIKTQIGEKK